jgi:hypothetical protein
LITCCERRGLPFFDSAIFPLLHDLYYLKAAISETSIRLTTFFQQAHIYS